MPSELTPPIATSSLTERFWVISRLPVILSQLVIIFSIIVPREKLILEPNVRFVESEISSSVIELSTICDEFTWLVFMCIEFTEADERCAAQTAPEAMSSDVRRIN